MENNQSTQEVKDTNEGYVVDEIMKNLGETAQSNKGKSHTFFQTTRVDSCSHVVVKNGVAQAVPFKTAKKPEQETKSSFTKSLYYDDYSIAPQMHAGMKEKPLVPYHPHSYRNRLPMPDAKKPPTNASSIEFGDRSTFNKKHFVTNTQNTYGNLAKNDPVTNSGILAEKTKWHHHLQSK